MIDGYRSIGKDAPVSNMEITTVILNWNRGEDTQKAVRSVLNQDKPAKEIIVWDNGSTDGSPDRLRSAFDGNPTVKIIEAKRNYGPATGRNLACKEATGDIFMFLDSDAELQSTNAFTLLAERFQENGSVAALNLEIKKPNGHVLWPFARDFDAWKTREFEITRVDGCGVAFQRKPFEEAGGFPDHFGYGAEEHYLARRCIALGYRILYFPAASVVHAAVSPGRTTDQFITTMRNHIWMPLELFRMPWAVLSAVNMLRSYFVDALHENRMRDFWRGFWLTIRDFRFSRRKPFSRTNWKHFRDIISEDRENA